MLLSFLLDLFQVSDIAAVASLHDCNFPCFAVGHGALQVWQSGSSGVVAYMFAVMSLFRRQVIM